MRSDAGYDPTVLGGDLNLEYGGSPDLRTCLPAGAAHPGDGGVQHVIVTPDIAVATARNIDMGGTTDHPGLLVSLVIVTSCPCSGRRPVA
jgi:hypothetical protein